jgi:hypothetical protein
MRFVSACLLVVAAWGAGLARAEEPTRQEERFLKSLVAALDHESADVRRVAEEALVLMGPKAAYHLVHDVKRVKPTARDAVVRILVAIGAPSRAEIAALRRLPSGDYGKVLAEVRAALEEGAGGAGFGAGDPVVAARVDAIMATLPKDSWSSNDPAIDRLVSLGREAIPALVKYLDPAAGDIGNMHADWAASALEKLCKAKDVVKLGALLDDGWGKVARVFKGMDERRGVPYMIRALERGQLTYDIASALLHFADSRSRKPVVTWLEAHGPEFAAGTGDLMDLCVALGAREAVPAILHILQAPDEAEPFNLPFDKEDRTRKEVLCGSALAGLGEPSGIPILISVVHLRGMRVDWLARRAGETLNRVTGQRFWQDGGDRRRAQQLYEAWWSENEKDLAWDEARKRFVVKKP